MNIENEMIEFTDRFGNKAMYAKYVLKEKQDAEVYSDR